LVDKINKIEIPRRANIKYESKQQNPEEKHVFGRICFDKQELLYSQIVTLPRTKHMVDPQPVAGIVHKLENSSRLVFNTSRCYRHHLHVHLHHKNNLHNPLILLHLYLLLLHNDHHWLQQQKQQLQVIKASRDHQQILIISSRMIIFI